jgi:hypothetical protein
MRVSHPRMYTDPLEGLIRGPASWVRLAFSETVDEERNPEVAELPRGLWNTH